jgi:hypothetical protein
MTSAAKREHRVDRTLPWVAGGSVLAGVLITALSRVPVRLPGIAFDSAGLFVAERGVAVMAVLTVGITLAGRTLNRELPIGFSTPAGSVTYAEKVEEVTTSSDTTVTELGERLNEQNAELSGLREGVDQLRQTDRQLAFAVAELRAIVQSTPPDDPPRG